MDNNEQYQLKFHILLIAAALVLFSDLLLSKVLNVFLVPVITTMIIRIIQIIILFILLQSNPLYLKLSGFSYQNIIEGIKTGVCCSVLLCLISLIVYFFLDITGINALQYLTIKLPENNFEVILFFIAGGIIAPIAEEIFFRGVIYTYFRKYSIIAALILSTTFFTFSHLPLNFFPVVQIIGGIIFALSFEYSKSLAAPIIIHISGNIAIFSLSYFFLI